MPHNIPKFWTNEFALSNTSTKMKKKSHVQIGSIIKEYARYCTLHGIQYVFKDNSTIIER